MKVLFTHDHTIYRFGQKYYSTGGLSNEVLQRYTSLFSKVYIATRQKQINQLNENLTLSSTSNVEFIKIHNFKSPTKIINYFEAKKKIEESIMKVDCVIARMPSSIGQLSIEIARKYDIPYMIEAVACPWDSYWNHSLIGKIIAPLEYFKMRKSVKESKYTLYVTNRFLQERYPTDGNEINCSDVVLSDFNSRILSNRITKIETRKPKDKIIIGTTAALNVKYKGQQYVIEALGKLKKDGINDFEYQLVGNGDQSFLRKQAIKHDLENEVKFIGSLPHNKVFNWLNNIDIYVQPSRQEGLPRALVEAMSKALPSFGADTAGIPELLDRKFIFSNTRKNIDEIQEILMSFTKEVEVEQAARNYQEAKNYDAEKIESRRNTFYLQFIKYVSESSLERNTKAVD